MGNDERPQKDIWDKLSVSSQLLTGLLIGFLTLVVQYKANEITTSVEQEASRLTNGVQTAQLVQSLIKDLTTEQTKQDIALIALNRSIGEQNPKMVVDISAQIFKERRKKSKPEDLSTSDVAFDIIKERDENKAKSLSLLLISESKSALRSSASVTSKPLPSKLEKPAPPSARFIAKVFSDNIVYIQFKDPANRGVAEDLRKELNVQSFNAPEIENVEAGNYQNSIRFFHKEDRDLAEKVSRVTENFLKRKGFNKNFEIQDLSSSYKVQKRQVEVWLSL